MFPAHVRLRKQRTHMRSVPERRRLPQFGADNAKIDSTAQRREALKRPILKGFGDGKTRREIVAAMLKSDCRTGV